MPQTLARKLIESHLLEGEMTPGEEIGLRIDQTLTQDATGTLVMLELEAMQLDRTRCELSAQYVDHNLLQLDHKNPDDHQFLLSASKRFGIWYSGPGNGVSHPNHMQHFGIPGKTLLGSDSHTPAAGSLGMLAIGAGGIDVARAIAGEPFYTRMPEIWGVELSGELPDWVSAKDVILEMLRRHGTDGGRGRIIEYHGPGLRHLSAMDRHVIANMGAELGATTTIFPADDEVRRFMAACGRENDFVELTADADCEYDVTEQIDLSSLQPLIAKPTSPGNVVPVTEIAGDPIYQAYIGSSANPGYRDFAVTAEMVKGQQVPDDVSFDINPTSRGLATRLTLESHLSSLIAAGARIHQPGCNGCIGMGQAPASGQISLRTTPRNFPGRSGTEDDKVFLCSPETAAASALAGKITDPRTLDLDYPQIDAPDSLEQHSELFVAPLPQDRAQKVELVKGPNIVTLPEFEPLPDSLELKILYKVGDYFTTDEIMPAGSDALPFRSNIPEISKFCFGTIDDDYAASAEAAGDHAIIAGRDYGQGSSREHAALGPRYRGLRLAIAKSFARIHLQNLASFGILALNFNDEDDYEQIQQGGTLRLKNLHTQLKSGDTIKADINGEEFSFTHSLSDRQRELLLAGGVINVLKSRLS